MSIHSMYINDLEEGVTNKTLKIEDDMTLFFRKTKDSGNKPKMQDDIDRLVGWSEKGQLLFFVW